MDTKNLILKQIRLKGSITSSDILKIKSISRQTIAQHFRELITQKKIVKVGSTRNARYFLFSSKSKHHSVSKFSNIYLIKGLNEDIVFKEISLKIGLKKALSDKAYQIVNYAFTEMLNNAIDHSKAKKVKVEVYYLGSNFSFTIIDNGIGVFENIQKKFKLKNHFESIEHLLKGKQTTAPKKHSGQGIFFTSKIADSFILESAKSKLIIDNKLEDVILEDIKFVKGTKVCFFIKQKSKKDLGELFKEYQDNNYEFDKTKLFVSITLSAKENTYISRSEAKRLLFGLDKFKRIVLDCKNIKGIGQGFADEIFRVYKSSHPNIKIEAINVPPSVEFMLKRVKN